MRAPEAYERLVQLVEWKLIEMPLPRLQIMGQSHRSFIYEIYWDQRVERREVTGYQRGAASSFDNRVMLRPGVGEYFLQLSGLLRPLIQRRWSAMVAQLNGLEESQLEMFLFGADRTRTVKIRAGLRVAIARPIVRFRIVLVIAGSEKPLTNARRSGDFSFNPLLITTVRLSRPSGIGDIIGPTSHRGAS
jgi:hypothetical protein